MPGSFSRAVGRLAATSLLGPRRSRRCHVISLLTGCIAGVPARARSVVVRGWPALAKPQECGCPILFALFAKRVGYQKPQPAGCPGPGSPRTGLSPWGGDPEFVTWDTTKACPQFPIPCSLFPIPYSLFPDFSPRKFADNFEPLAHNHFMVSFTTCAARSDIAAAGARSQELEAKSWKLGASETPVTPLASILCKELQ